MKNMIMLSFAKFISRIVPLIALSFLFVESCTNNSVETADDKNAAVNEQLAKLDIGDIFSPNEYPVVLSEKTIYPELVNTAPEKKYKVCHVVHDEYIGCYYFTVSSQLIIQKKEYTKYMHVVQ